MAGKIQLIGAVGIKVRPDTSEFKQELREQVRNLPDYDIEVNVDADTTIAKRKLQKLKDEAEKNSLKLTLDEDVFDDIQNAQRQIKKAIAGLSQETITIGLNDKELQAKLKNLQNKARGATVNMEYNDDKAGYEAILAKIRNIRRQKMVQEVQFKTDNKSLAETQSKFEKLLADLPTPVKTLTIKHRNDHESLTSAIAQIDQAMADLKQVEINPKLTWTQLQAEKKKLQKELADKPLIMKVTEDKDSYEAVLKKITDLQKQAAATEFKFQTDADSLDQAAQVVRDKIAALTPKPNITFTYENDSRGMHGALKEVEKRLADLGRIKLTADLDEAGLLKAKEELETQLATSTFKIDVDSTDLDALKAQAKNLEDMMKVYNIPDVSITVENTPEDMERAKRELEELVKKREAEIKAKPVTWDAMLELAYASRARDVPFYVRINQRSLAIAEGTLKSLAGINFLQSSGRSFENLITNFDTMSIKAGLLGAVVGGLANTFTYLGTALFPVAEGMLNVVGLLAMAPAAMSAMTAVAVVNIAAWKNFGDAVDGSAEALGKLPKEAQDTALALRGTWTEMQKPIQTAFWSGMGSSMKDSITKFLPIVTEGLTGAAEHIGRFTAGVFKSMEKVALNGDLAKMFSNLELMFDNASGAAEPLVDAINRLGLRGSEYLPRFGQWLTDISIRFDEWIRKADEAGHIKIWIDQAIQSLKDMWTLGGGIAKMFQGINNAAKTAGAGGLGDVAKRFDEIGTMMKEEPFQSRLSTIFNGARKGASELNVGVKELGQTFGESSLWVANMLQELGRLGGGLLTGLADSMGNLQFQAGLLDSVEGMNTMVGELRTGFDALGSIVGNLGSIAGAAFESLAPVINRVLESMAVIVNNLSPSLQTLIPTLMGMVGGLVEMLAGPLEGMSAALGAVLDWINSLGGPMSSLLTSFIAFVLLAGKIGPIFAASKTGSLFTTMKKEILEADGAREKFSTGIKGIGAAALGMVGGPWGLAIGALTAGLALIGQANAEAKSRVDAYTASLDKNTGAVTANSLAQAADDLLDKAGMWEDFTRGAKKTQETLQILGKDFQETAAIAANGGPAYDDLMEKLKKYPGVTGDSRGSMKEFADAMGITEEQAKSLSQGDLAHLIERLKRVHGELATGKDDWKNLNSEIQNTQFDAAAKKVSDFNTAMRLYNDSTATADTRTRALDQALDLLNGKTMDLTAATRTANDSTRAMAGTQQELEGVVKTTGGAFHDANGNLAVFNEMIDATTGVIDTTSAAGSNLSKMLQAATTDTKNVATGMKDAGKPIEEVAKYLDGQRESFIKLGVDAGLNKDVVTKAYDEMIKANPKDLLTTIMTEGVVDAKTGVIDYAKSLDQLNGRKAVATISGDDVLLGAKLALSYDNLAKFDEVVATATADLDPSAADAKRQQLLIDLANLAATNPTVAAHLDPAILEAERQRIVARLEELGRMTPTPAVDAETTAANEKLKVVQGGLDGIARSAPKPTVDAETSSADSKADTTKGKLQDVGRQKPVASVTVTGTETANQALDIMMGKLEPFNKKLYSFQVRADVDSNSLNLIQSIKGANGGIIDGLGRGLHGFSLEKFANGGFHMGRPVKAYASGGVENHVAQIARGATPYRVWAEPETGGEAYIPLSQAKRGRSTQILEQVAKQFGYNLTKASVFADGGVVNGGNARATSGMQIHIDTFNQNAQDTIEDVGRGIMRQARNAGMAGIMDGI